MLPPPEIPEAPPQAAPYTAWHCLLAQTLQALLDPSLLTVLAFYKLGTLPLEPDVILLRKERDADLAALVPDFAFALRHLAPLTVIEYKSPGESLAWAHLDTARAYYFLAKRKFKLRYTRDLALHLWYSYLERDFLEVCEHNGLVFAPVEPGVMCSQGAGERIYLMDLVKLSDQHPQDAINLLSARHRRFVLEAGPPGPRQAALARLYYILWQEMTKMLNQSPARDLPGSQEVMDDLQEIKRKFAAALSEDEVLELIKGWAPEKRLQGLSPEDRLQGLSSEERARLRQLLSQ